jgi:hypothetical protein
MPTYKTKSEEYKEIIARERISKLYHFTDRDNLDSIIAAGGLYSWADCAANNITIAKPGGDDTSRSLDRRDVLQHFVRLSLCSDHPMKYVAMNDGRIDNPVLLEISPEVIYWFETRYADRNATKNGAQIGSDIDDFEEIHFSSVRASNQFDLPEEEKEFYQAEVLVKNFIPLEYILNIRDFGIQLPTQTKLTHRSPYTAQVTRDTPTAFIFLVDQSISMNRSTLLYGEPLTLSEAVARIVNRSIEELVNRCIKGSEVRRYFDIAIIGYGDEAQSAWQGKLVGRDFVTPEELRQSPYKTITAREEKRTRRGVEIKEVQRTQWLEAKHQGKQTRLDKAVRYAQRLLEQWCAEHRGKVCYPPTVINITDGEYNAVSHEEMLQIAGELKSIETLDGNTLFFNIHISPTTLQTTSFPEEPTGLEPLAQRLYALSSLLPERYNLSISQLLGADSSVTKRKRGLVVNADMATLIKTIEIGTPTNISNNL